MNIIYLLQVMMALTLASSDPSAQASDRRQLYTTISDSSVKSNQCKKECIDEGKNFCPSSDFYEGRCYEDGEPFSRMVGTFCSKDATRAPKEFQYLACPNEKACGSKIITPSYSGEVLTRAVDKWNYRFVQDDICSYIIRAPSQMAPGDTMRVKILKIDKANVYVAKAKKKYAYRWLDHLDAYAVNGNVFDTKADWEIYVVGVSNSFLQGTFEIKVWIDHDDSSPPPPSNPSSNPSTGGSNPTTGTQTGTGSTNPPPSGHPSQNQTSQNSTNSTTGGSTGNQNPGSSTQTGAGGGMTNPQRPPSGNNQQPGDHSGHPSGPLSPSGPDAPGQEGGDKGGSGVLVFLIVLFVVGGIIGTVLYLRNKRVHVTTQGQGFPSTKEAEAMKKGALQMTKQDKQSKQLTGGDLPEGLSDVEDETIVEGKLQPQNSESNLDAKIKDIDSVRSFSTAGGGGFDRRDSSSFGVFNQPPAVDQASQMLQLLKLQQMMTSLQQVQQIQPNASANNQLALMQTLLQMQQQPQNPMTQLLNPTSLPQLPQISTFTATPLGAMTPMTPLGEIPAPTTLPQLQPNASNHSLHSNAPLMDPGFNLNLQGLNPSTGSAYSERNFPQSDQISIHSYMQPQANLPPQTLSMAQFGSELGEVSSSSQAPGGKRGKKKKKKKVKKQNSVQQLSEDQVLALEANAIRAQIEKEERKPLNFTPVREFPDELEHLPEAVNFHGSEGVAPAENSVADDEFNFEGLEMRPDLD